MAVRQFQVLEDLPYLPDLTPANFFLFPRVKRELACRMLTKDTFKKKWEWAARTLKMANLPWSSGSDISTAKNVSTSLGPTLKKAQTKLISIYNCFFTEDFRQLCKHTSYNKIL
jgi:hypothetical protein